MGPSLKHIYEHNSFTFKADGAHMLLFGKQDVLPSSLIYSKELSFLDRSDLIEKIYFCYMLSPFFLSSQVSSVDNLSLSVNETPVNHVSLSIFHLLDDNLLG